METTMTDLELACIEAAEYAECEWCVPTQAEYAELLHPDALAEMSA